MSFDREALRREAQAAAREALADVGFPEAGDRLAELNGIQIEQVRCRLINLLGKAHEQHRAELIKALDALGIFWGRR